MHLTIEHRYLGITKLKNSTLLRIYTRNMIVVGIQHRNWKKNQISGSLLYLCIISFTFKKHKIAISNWLYPLNGQILTHPVDFFYFIPLLYPFYLHTHSCKHIKLVDHQCRPSLRHIPSLCWRGHVNCCYLRWWNHTIHAYIK